MIVMGIYRRSNTNKQREGNLLNIFVLEKNLKSYLITFYLETTNKICHPSFLLSFYLLLYHLPSSNYFINNSFAPSLLLSFIYYHSLLLLLLRSFLTSSLFSPSPSCFAFSSLFYQSFFTFFSKYVLFIHY